MTSIKGSNKKCKSINLAHYSKTECTKFVNRVIIIKNYHVQGGLVKK